MNNLKVQDFHGKQVIDNLSLLEEAVEELVKMAFINPNNAMELADLPFEFVDTPWIKFCVQRTITEFLVNSFPSERDVYEWFRESYKSVMGPQWTIVDRKSDPKHIPDFWITDGKKQVPVECKLMEFNIKSLKQLQRYMNFYGSDCGVAVASSCTCELPSNVTFVPFNYHDFLVSRSFVKEGKKDG